jgi:phage terminase large subunit
MANVEIEFIDRFAPLLVKPKRIKILVGGRASTKSTFVADHVIERMSSGETWCCAREYQNSLDESVHSMLKDEIERLEFPGFLIQANKILYPSNGGGNFYRGLARNISGLKGLNCHGLWIEEGEATSKATLKVLTASIRVSALEQAKARREGKEIRIPEIWITMNRGSSKDPIAQRLLKRAERELARCGYYEDDLCMIIEVNYPDNPWFEGSGLEVERKDDEENMTPAEYDHKWHGAYSDTVENAIIRPDWFDACVDAHEKLGWKAEGVEAVSHDPSDKGDPKALAYRHGSVIVDCIQKTDGDFNDGIDWATDYAIMVQADEFIWDGDGIGAAARRDINKALGNKKIAIGMFKGSETADYPDRIYQPIHGEIMKPKPNKQVFANKRAQYYWDLRDRCFKTWQAVTKGMYHNPDDLISFASDIEDLPLLRAEVCGIPKKDNGAGKIQIVAKQDMKKNPYNLESPNMADCVMMSLAAGKSDKRGKSSTNSSNHTGGWQSI